MRILPALAMAFAGLSSQALAAGDCSTARHVSHLHIESKQLLAETQPAAAAQIVSRLTTHLEILRETSPHSSRTAAGSATQRMQAYIDTREAMVGVYKREGLGAAQAYLRSTPVATIDAAVRDIEALLDCGGRLEAIEGAGFSAAAAGQQGAIGPLGYLVGHHGTPPATSWGYRILPIAAMLFLTALGALCAFLMNRRSYTRHPCDIPALVMIQDGTLFGRIANVSRGGAKIRVANEIRPPQRGSVLLGDGTAIGFRVEWANSHFIGVSFHPKLDFSPARLIKALGCGSSVIGEDHLKPPESGPATYNEHA